MKTPVQDELRRVGVTRENGIFIRATTKYYRIIIKHVVQVFTCAPDV